VIAELTGEGSEAPAIMVMDGPYKYIHCETDPPQLYDRSQDRFEKNNIAGQLNTAEVEVHLASHIAENWDLKKLKQKVIASQIERRVVDRAHALGKTPDWNYDPGVPGRDQYFRATSANPSASNYNDDFDLRLRPDSGKPNVRNYPKSK